MRMRATRRFDDSLRIHVAEARDVLRDRPGKEFDVLRQIADVQTESVARPARDVRTVETHDAGIRSPYA